MYKVFQIEGGAVVTDKGEATLTRGGQTHSRKNRVPIGKEGWRQMRAFIAAGPALYNAVSDARELLRKIPDSAVNSGQLVSDVRMALAQALREFDHYLRGEGDAFEQKLQPSAVAPIGMVIIRGKIGGDSAVWLYVTHEDKLEKLDKKAKPATFTVEEARERVAAYRQQYPQWTFETVSPFTGAT